MSRIVLVGRSNVGKSSLFNKILKATSAITHASKNTTRDYKEAQYVSRSGARHVLIDTGGMCTSSTDQMAKAIASQTTQALRRADLVLFVVDAKSGLTPQDQEIAHLLRKRGLPVVLVLNKCDVRKRYDATEFARLGFSQAIEVSAEFGLNIADLERVMDLLPSNEEQLQPQIKLALFGRPNVGKSSLINALCRLYSVTDASEDRVLVHKDAGTTRDTVTVPLTSQISLVDTAGLARRSSGQELEAEAEQRTRAFIEQIDVAALVVDITKGRLEHQDLKIAQALAVAGKSAFIVANKLDLISNAEVDAALDELRHQAAIKLSDFGQIPIVPVSAHTVRNLKSVLKIAAALHAKADTHFSTSKLNKAVSSLKAGTSLRLPKYVVQTSTRPLHFTFFGASAHTRNYARYLKHNLHRLFDMDGVPVFISLESGKRRG